MKVKVGLDDVPLQLHRLDKLTTGALLLATTATHARALSQQFQDHVVHKTYLALVRGGRKSFHGNAKGTISSRIKVAPDGRVKVDEGHGEVAMTDWKLLGSSVCLRCTHLNRIILTFRNSQEKVPLSLLHLSLLTGIKHQLRIHLAETLQCKLKLL